MEKEENGCRSPSTASSSSESYWGWEWRRTMNIWTCVYCNLLYTSCIAWVITLATEIRQNEPPWASETSSDMWSPRGARRRYAPLAPWGGSHITALSPQLTGVHSRITLLSSGDTLYESPSPRSITSAIFSSKIFISRRDVKNKLTKTYRVNTLGNRGYIG